MVPALLLLLGLLSSALEGGDVSARWSCEPAQVELGEPFALVLELEHPAAVRGRGLASGQLLLDESWVVFGEESVRTEPHGAGMLRTRRAWSVASLEPGERSLGEALSGVALSQLVTRISVGDARILVQGILAQGEDEPRGLREFPEGFLGPAPDEEGRALLPALVAAGLLAVGVLAWVLLRRRRGRSATPASVPALERLGQLERDLDGERGRESCFELTRLVRSSVDRLRRRQRPGLDDEEWLRELGASFDIPRNIVQDLERLFARAARVKYAGEVPTSWALQETFAGARAALEAIEPGRARKDAGSKNGKPGSEGRP